MADHDNNPSATRPAWPGPRVIRMGSLAGGALGLLGFSLAIFCGLAADNSIAEVLTRAFFTSLALAAVGAAAGLVASHLLVEHIQRQLSQRAQANADASQAESAQQSTEEQSS